MALKPGTILNYPGNLVDSMAEAMDEAFRREWGLNMEIPLPDTGTKERLMFFSAISQGILSHLRDHLPGATTISARVVQVVEGDENRPIESENTTGEIDVYRQLGVGEEKVGYVKTGHAKVQQTSEPVNSEGEAVIKRIEVEGI